MPDTFTFLATPLASDPDADQARPADDAQRGRPETRHALQRQLLWSDIEAFGISDHGRMPVSPRVDSKVQEILTGTDVSTLRRIYDEVSIDDQCAEWAMIGLG